MTFMLLPNEILTAIVEWSRPDAFESLALTCKRLYELSEPFIERHYDMRYTFRDFVYCCEPGRRIKLVAASDLITLIATEPVVAQYIRVADLGYDSVLLRYALAWEGRPKSVPRIQSGGEVVKLFANSPYLQRAGLDWEEFYLTFEEDVQNGRYSQHGAAFLLTLLPYTEKVILPDRWESNEATTKLLDALVDEAKQSSPLHTSSLASLQRLQYSGRCDGTSTISVRPLLALPHMESVSCSSCLAVGEALSSLGLRSSRRIAETLVVAQFDYCYIDHAGITDFLMHTPQLKTLTYRHHTEDYYPVHDWDLCKFVNAVVREAGSHLIEFSVILHELRGDIVPGKASMRGFQKLKKLEYPLELVMCNINATGIATHIAGSLRRLLNSSEDPFMRDLIPSSVTQLSLKSEMTVNHEQTLVALFQNFRAVRKSQLPALQEMVLGCRSSDDRYKQLSNSLVREARAEGIHVELDAFNSSTSSFNWCSG